MAKLSLFDRRRRRVRSALRSRASGKPRLSVHRSGRHIYAQVIDDTAGHTLAAASSVEPSLKSVFSGKANGGNLYRFGRINNDCGSGMIRRARNTPSEMPLPTSFADLTVREFLEALGSDRPTAKVAVLAAISVCHMLNDVIQSLIMAIYPMLKSALSLDFSQIGIITFTFQGTASLLQPVVG